MKEEEKEKEREGKGDRVSELKKDYTVNVTYFPMVLCCLCAVHCLTLQQIFSVHSVSTVQMLYQGMIHMIDTIIDGLNLIILQMFPRNVYIFCSLF